MRRILILAGLLGVGRVMALDIQLPLETGTFKQDTGAEMANGQCLLCHSVVGPSSAALCLLCGLSWLRASS